MAKKIRLSADNGVTWYTLPGNAGELANEAGTIDDTIFGSDYKSMQSGLLGWTVNTNGLYKGFAGYVASIKKSGTPTTMTAEAMSLVSGKTYKVTNATKQTFSPDDALTVLDNAVAVSAANILNVDYIYGRVTFVSGYTPTGPITVTGKYLPLTTIARATGFTLTQTADTVDDTDFATAQSNGGYRAHLYGLKTASLSLAGIMSGANDWRASLESRSRVVVEINPDGSGKSVGRGFFMYTQVSESGNVGAQEAATATLPLQVPDVQNMAYPFSWLHDPSTTLNMAVQIAMNAWLNNLPVEVQYLRDGVNGVQGNAIVTDLSLAGGLEVMNEFTIHLQGTNATVVVP